MPLHKCTEEDWAEFYSPDDSAQILFDIYETFAEIDLRELFLCFDWTEDLIIKPDDMATLKLTYLPCHQENDLRKRFDAYDV